MHMSRANIGKKEIPSSKMFTHFLCKSAVLFFLFRSHLLRVSLVVGLMTGSFKSLFLPVIHVVDESGCMGFRTVEDIAAEGSAEHSSLLHVPMIE